MNSQRPIPPFGASTNRKSMHVDDIEIAYTTEEFPVACLPLPLPPLRRPRNLECSLVESLRRRQPCPQSCPATPPPAGCPCAPSPDGCTNAHIIIARAIDQFENIFFNYLYARLITDMQWWCNKTPTSRTISP